MGASGTAVGSGHFIRPRRPGDFAEAACIGFTAEGAEGAEKDTTREFGRDALYWELEGNRAVRAGKWKLVVRAGGPWELYDLDADPVELADLAAKEPDRVRDLAAKWDEWAKRVNVEPWPVGRPAKKE